MDKVDVRVEGLPQLRRGFDEFVDDLADEMAPGFVPEHRYAGLEGEPFTLDKVELVATRLGFTIRGEGL